MGPVTFERAGRGLRIQPSGFLHSGTWPPDRHAEGAWRISSQTDRFTVRSLLREFVWGDRDCRKLRELIGETGGIGSSRLDNEQLIDTVAEMVTASRLLVLEKAVEAGSNAKRHVMRSATIKYTSIESACTPAQLRSQLSLTDALAAAQPSPAVEESFVANVDQDVQAGVLKAAAANGVPFCEMCEKAKQARAEQDISQASAS